MMLGELCSRHFVTKGHLKLSTVQKIESCYSHLQEYFGVDTCLREIVELEVERFYRLSLERLSKVTVSRNFRDFRSLFSYALEQRFVSFNPFPRVARFDVNVDRHFYVDRSMVVRILEHCRDDRERLLVVLCRYAGLRIPSEIRDLRFCDMRDNRIRIHKGTKTGVRLIPMFSEVREIFSRLSGFPDELIFSDVFGDVRNILLRAIRLSGVVRWPKLFINMRSSLITDLMRMGYCSKSLDSFFGNTEGVRRIHYEQYNRDREYARMLSDNSMMARYLHENANTDVLMELEYLLQEKISAVKTLATHF
jgi:hypothetical protein